MPAPANSRVESLIPRPTAFKTGVSGNPKGRRRGSRNRATVEAREFAGRLIDDPEYRESLRRRLISGSAGAMEATVWAYALGKPVDRVEQGAPGAFAALTNEELKRRLLAALAVMPADYHEQAEAIEVLEMNRHPYAWRTALRKRLPWFVIDLGIAAKGEDCEKAGATHHWYKQDDQYSACYHCTVTKPGRLWERTSNPSQSR